MTSRSGVIALAAAGIVLATVLFLVASVPVMDFHAAVIKAKAPAAGKGACYAMNGVEATICTNNLTEQQCGKPEDSFIFWDKGGACLPDPKTATKVCEKEGYDLVRTEMQGPSREVAERGCYAKLYTFADRKCKDPTCLGLVIGLQTTKAHKNAHEPGWTAVCKGVLYSYPLSGLVSVEEQGPTCLVGTPSPSPSPSPTLSSTPIPTPTSTSTASPTATATSTPTPTSTSPPGTITVF